MGFGTKNPTVNPQGIFGQTLAICGMGAIGSAVVERAKGFGLHIKTWSRSLTPDTG